jgi:hypothetical protein
VAPRAEIPALRHTKGRRGYKGKKPWVSLPWGCRIKISNILG